MLLMILMGRRRRLVLVSVRGVCRLICLCRRRWFLRMIICVVPVPCSGRVIPLTIRMLRCVMSRGFWFGLRCVGRGGRGLRFRLRLWLRMSLMIILLVLGSWLCCPLWVSVMTLFTIRLPVCRCLTMCYRCVRVRFVLGPWRMVVVCVVTLLITIRLRLRGLMIWLWLLLFWWE